MSIRKSRSDWPRGYLGYAKVEPAIGTYCVFVGTEAFRNPYELHDSSAFEVQYWSADYKKTTDSVQDVAVLESLRDAVKKQHIKLELVWRDGLCRCAG